MHLSQPFLRLPKSFCAETIAAEVAALGPEAWVPHPGKLPGNDAVLLITPNGQMTNAFTGPMGPTDHLRRCPYIMEIMADIGAVWGRSRLMGLAAGADVPPHVDVGYYWRTHTRIHIPVVTTPKVVFTCDDKSVHMAPGECWIFDSFRRHNVRNGGTEKRIHLVLDTVGGEALWDLVERAQQDGDEEPETLRPGVMRTDLLAFEQLNAPGVMTPWEVRCHVDFLLEKVAPGADIRPIGRRLERFADAWGATWAQFGPEERGLQTYQGLVASVERDMRALGAAAILLTNDVPLERALSELIFRVAFPPPGAQSPPLQMAAGQRRLS